MFPIRPIVNYFTNKSMHSKVKGEEKEISPIVNIFSFFLYIYDIGDRRMRKGCHVTFIPSQSIY